MDRKFLKCTTFMHLGITKKGRIGFMRLSRGGESLYARVDDFLLKGVPESLVEDGVEPIRTRGFERFESLQN